MIVLIGILSGIAVTRFSGRQPFDEFGYVQELAAAARYAQKLAVATRCPVRFEIESATQYRLTRKNAFTSGTCAGTFDAQVVNPATAQPPYAGTAPSQVSMSVTGGFPAERVFDAQGGISPATDLSVQIGDRTVLVRSGSGQVTVQVTGP